VQLTDAVPADAGVGKDDPGSIPGAFQVSPANADLAAAQRLAGFFDKTPVLVKVESGFDFNGVSFPEPGGALYKHFFLNVASPHPYLVVAGHELIHTMKVEAPEAYRGLKQAMMPLIRKTDEFRERFKMQDSPAENVIDELMGNTLGNTLGGRMMERTFREESAGRKPKAFEKIVNYVLGFLNKILKRGRGWGRSTSFPR